MKKHNNCLQDWSQFLAACYGECDTWARRLTSHLSLLAFQSGEPIINIINIMFISIAQTIFTSTPA